MPQLPAHVAEGEQKWHPCGTLCSALVQHYELCRSSAHLQPAHHCVSLPSLVLCLCFPQKTMYNAEKRGKKQVLLRPSSKVVIKFLSLMMKHGEQEGSTGGAPVSSRAWWQPLQQPHPAAAALG